MFNLIIFTMKKLLLCNIHTITELYLALTLNIKKLLGRFIKKIINKKKLKKKLKKNIFNLRDKFYLLYKRYCLSYTIKRYFYLKHDHIVLEKRASTALIIYLKLFNFVCVANENPVGRLLLNLMLECYWNELSLTSFNDLFWENPHYINIDINPYVYQYINPNVNNTHTGRLPPGNNTHTGMLPPGNWSKHLPKPEMMTYGKKPSGIYSSGFLPTPDAVDTRREFDKHPFEMDKHRRRKLVSGPRYKFLWISENGKKKLWVYPESYHYEPMKRSHFANTLRIYEDANIKYSYHTQQYQINDRFCNITYPDGTHLTIYNKKVVLEHIKYHHKHISMNIKQKPHFFYDRWYKEHFEPFRKAKINAFFSREKPSFKRESITINELLNPVKENNDSNTKKIGINNLLNVDNNNNYNNYNNNSNLNTKKIGINDLLNVDSNSNNSSSLNTKKISINDLLNIDNDNSNLNTNQITINNLSDKNKDKDKVIDKKSFKYFVENSKKKIDPFYCVKTKKGWVDLTTIDWNDNSPKNRVLKKLYYERVR